MRCFIGIFVRPYRGAQRGGRGVQWSRGPWASGRPLASAGPEEGPWAREGAHRKDTEKSACEAWRPFFWGSSNFDRKKVRISVKTFFFFVADHIIFWTKSQHFLFLFWTSQNRKSVIFELAPGPLLLSGGTASISTLAILSDTRQSFPKKTFEISLLSFKHKNFEQNFYRYVTVRIRACKNVDKKVHAKGTLFLQQPTQSLQILFCNWTSIANRIWRKRFIFNVKLYC